MDSHVIMKLSREIVGMLVLGLCMISYGSTASDESTTAVYFVPFEVETYIPITPETIVSQAWEKWTVPSTKEKFQLLQILRRGPEGRVDENRTRALIISENKSYYVDSNGIVHTDGRPDIKIDKLALMKFRDSLPHKQREILKKQPKPTN